jgi:hypothetical protein
MVSFVYTWTNELVVSGAGITPKMYNLADLEEMTQVTYTRTVQAGWRDLYGTLVAKCTQGLRR